MVDGLLVVETPAAAPATPAAPATAEVSTELAVMVGELRAEVTTLKTELEAVKSSASQAQGSADYAARTAERAETAVAEVVTELEPEEIAEETPAATVVEFPPVAENEAVPESPKAKRGLLLAIFLGSK